MKRRDFLRSAWTGTALAGDMMVGAETARAEPAPAGPETGPPPLLDTHPVIVYESPTPKTVYAYSPGIAALPSGRLIATMDQGGPGSKDKPAKPKEGKVKRERPWNGKIYISDDCGAAWKEVSAMPLGFARPFAAGTAVYIIGTCKGLAIMRSGDEGLTWGEPVWLNKDKQWHQAPSNVHYANGRVYLVMESVTDPAFPMWPVSVLAPVVMSADVNSDLTQTESWTFSNELSYKQLIEEAGEPNLIGVPFLPTGALALMSPGDKRLNPPAGWLETNIVQFNDPDHVWYDPKGRTFYLWMRAHTASTNLAAIAKAVEDETGAITVSPAVAPSGKTMLYVPCPGGHLKFHILYDEPGKLFWMVSNQSTDSMTRPDRLPENRYNLPNNERHRLVLHFSKNCVDWCFAGRVADTGAPDQSRNYPAMAINGDDLCILARSGDARAKSAHDGNLITFHRIRGFRELAY